MKPSENVLIMAPSHHDDQLQRSPNVLDISPKIWQIPTRSNLLRSLNVYMIMGVFPTIPTRVKRFSSVSERLGNVPLQSLRISQRSINVCLTICERTKRLSTDRLTFCWRSHDVSLQGIKGRWQTSLSSIFISNLLVPSPFHLGIIILR